MHLFRKWFQETLLTRENLQNQSLSDLHWAPCIFPFSRQSVRQSINAYQTNPFYVVRHTKYQQSLIIPNRDECKDISYGCIILTSSSWWVCLMLLYCTFRHNTFSVKEASDSPVCACNQHRSICLSGRRVKFECWTLCTLGFFLIYSEFPYRVFVSLISFS